MSTACPGTRAVPRCGPCSRACTRGLDPGIARQLSASPCALPAGPPAASAHLRRPSQASSTLMQVRRIGYCAAAIFVRVRQLPDARVPAPGFSLPQREDAAFAPQIPDAAVPVDRASAKTTRAVDTPCSSIPANCSSCPGRASFSDGVPRECSIRGSVPHLRNSRHRLTSARRLMLHLRYRPPRRFCGARSARRRLERDCVQAPSVLQ